MEDFLLVLGFIAIPAVVYLVMAEEVDDSLSHKIPSEPSPDRRTLNEPAGPAEKPALKRKGRDDVPAAGSGEPRGSPLTLGEGIHWVGRGIYYLFVGVSALFMMLITFMVIVGVFAGEMDPFLGMLFMVGVGAKGYEAYRQFHYRSGNGDDEIPLRGLTRSRPPAEPDTSSPEEKGAPVEQAPSSPPGTIVIEQRTFLGSLLRAILVVCGGVMLAAMLLRMKGIEWIPSWIIIDAILGFITAAVLVRYAKCGYTIDLVARTIVHEEMTPLYVRRRNIAFGEIRAVTVRGSQKGWPLLYKYQYMEFQIVIVFDGGLVLPVYDPVRSSLHLFGALERERRRAMELADMLGCPLFPWQHLGESHFEKWRSEIIDLRSRTSQPESLETSLLEAYYSSLGLGMIGPRQVKADMTTRFEMFILALVVTFIGATTWYGLSTEWRYLAENPRILYLILLDCTSIVVTVFGLWHLLVDEYYVFDADAMIIEYHSRWAFWKTTRVIGRFDEIWDVRINKVLSISSLKRQYVAEIKLSKDRRLQVSDKSPAPGIPVFRAFVLTRLFGRKIIDDPDVFEDGVRDIRPIDDPPASRPGPSGTSSWAPTGLGGILPPPAAELLEPPELGGRRKKKRRKKSRK